MGRIQPDRRQHRHDFAEKIIANPLELRFIPLAAPEKTDAFCGQCRQDLPVEQCVLFGDQSMCRITDPIIGRLRRQSIHRHFARIELDLFLETGEANFKEPVEIAADDAQKTQAFEQRCGRIACLRQHAPVEG